jgi:hypothetical protein
MALDRQDDPFSGPSLRDVDREALVRFLVDQRGLARGQVVAVYLVRSLGRFVFHGIQQGGVVGRPGHCRDSLRDLSFRAAVQFAHAQSILTISDRVD